MDFVVPHPLLKNDLALSNVTPDLIDFSEV